MDKENKDLVAENKDLKNREMDPTAHYINSSDYEDGVIDEKVVASYETAVAQLLKAAKYSKFNLEPTLQLAS